MGSLIESLSRTGVDAWCISPSEEGDVEWIPILQVSDSGVWIGLDRKGLWAVGRPDGKVSPPSAKMSPGWLTVLEMTEEEFLDRLAQAVAPLGLDFEVLKSRIPVSDFLTMALRGGSDHWMERAILWIQERVPSDEQIQLLEDISESKQVGQRVRHAAKRLVRKGGDREVN